MKTTIAALATAAAVANPIAAAAATRKKVTTTTKNVAGPRVQANRWGLLQVTLVVKRTTTTVGKKRAVTRKITGVRVPVYPNHTDRSVFINQQALPMLAQEALTAQFAGNIGLVSGATDTSYAFSQSLQAAILAAKKA